MTAQKQERPLSERTSQHEIDARNLEFYARCFAEEKWEVRGMSWTVYEQTLRETAQRIRTLEQQLSASREEVKQLQCAIDLHKATIETLEKERDGIRNKLHTLGEHSARMESRAAKAENLLAAASDAPAQTKGGHAACQTDTRSTVSALNVTEALSI